MKTKSKIISLCILCAVILAGLSITASATSSYGTLQNSVSTVGSYAVDYVWSSAFENMLGMYPRNYDSVYGLKEGYYDYTTGVSAGVAFGQYVNIGRENSHGRAVIQNYANWNYDSTKTIHY